MRSGGGASDLAVVWKLAADGSLQPIQIRTGITDHTVTELKAVVKGDLKDTDELIVGQSSSGNRGASGPGGLGGGGRGPGR